MKKYIPFTKFEGFTLTEVLVATLIVGIIATLVIPSIVTQYQNKVFDTAYKREIQSITDAVDGLVASEQVSSFFDTKMYLVEEPEGNYDESSGYFLKKYFSIARYCGDETGLCFAKDYVKYENRTSTAYSMDVKGSCVLLKNGMGLCISPQIFDEAIRGYIDLNGQRGPNVYGRDLREFYMPLQTRTALNDTTNKKVTNYCKDNPTAAVCTSSSGGVCDNPPTSHDDECCNATLHPESTWLNKDVCKMPDLCSSAPSSYTSSCCNDPRYSNTYTCDPVIKFNCSTNIKNYSQLSANRIKFDTSCKFAVNFGNNSNDIFKLKKLSINYRDAYNVTNESTKEYSNSTPASINTGTSYDFIQRYSQTCYENYYSKSSFDVAEAYRNNCVPRVLDVEICNSGSCATSDGIENNIDSNIDKAEYNFSFKVKKFLL